MRRPPQRSITLRSVRQPKWGAPDHSSIDCLVVFDHMPGELPFTAAPYDSEPHGRELFRRLVAGEFGEITPFEPRPIDTAALTQSAESFARFANTPTGAEWLAEIADHNEEVASGSSRGLAALAETHLSKRLARLLQIAGVQDSKIERMSFAKKIVKAETLGKISQTERVSLDLLRKIRNEVLHENGNFYTLKVFNFTQQLHSCLAAYITYNPLTSLADPWIDLIFMDAFSLIDMSLRARADPNVQARIVL